MTMTDPMLAKRGQTTAPEGVRPAPCCPLDVAGEDDFRRASRRRRRPCRRGAPARWRRCLLTRGGGTGSARRPGAAVGAARSAPSPPNLPHLYHDDADWRYMGQIRRGRGCTSSTTRGCRRGCSPRGPWTCSPRCTSAGAGRPPTSRPTPRRSAPSSSPRASRPPGPSNRIEGIRTTDARLRGIVEGRAEPRTRDEEEIAGYRDVLATIHGEPRLDRAHPRRDPPAPPGPVPANPAVVRRQVQGHGQRDRGHPTLR